MPQYKLTYGSRTLTYPGWNGYLQYSVTDKQLYDNYTLLWEGADSRTGISLSGSYEDYDALLFVGPNNLVVPKDELVRYNGRVDLTVPLNKKALGTDVPYFSERGQKINITDGTEVNAVSSFCAGWPTGRWNNSSYFFGWTKIYGVKYAE